MIISNSFYELQRWPNSIVVAYNRNIIKNNKSKNKRHNRPQFKHDCANCKYLGRHQDAVYKYDLYYCGDNTNHNKVTNTVIARFGDEGGQYQSGLNSTLPELVEAKRRAVMKGLLSVSHYPNLESSPSAAEIPHYKVLRDKEFCTFLGRYFHYDLYYQSRDKVVLSFYDDNKYHWGRIQYTQTTNGLNEAKSRAIEKKLWVSAATVSMPIQSPRFKHEKVKDAKFLGWGDYSDSFWDLYLDKDNQIIATWKLYGEVDWMNVAYKSALWKKAQELMAKTNTTPKPETSPTATEFYSRYSIIGYCVLRIWLPNQFRKETTGNRYDYVNKTWCRQNQDGTISSGASYTGAAQPIFDKKTVDKLNKGVAIYSSRVRAERIIPLIEHEWKECEFCVMPVMEKRDYSKEKYKCEVLIKSETFIPSSEP